MTPSDQRSLPARILDTPHLERVVPHLEPSVVHRLIETCGLEDCGSLVALLTPRQLTRVFDFDLWRSVAPGVDDRFEAARFGLWLEVIVESGVAAGAAKLAETDIDLLTAAFAQHVFVFDPATQPGRLAAEIGGYLVEPKGEAAWDAIVAILSALDAEHRACFERVMQGCRRLSHSRAELDGLSYLLATDAQAMFDLAASRDERREKNGYIIPAQARAFLVMSREVRRDGEAPSGDHPIARACFRDLGSPPDTDRSLGELAEDTEPTSAAEFNADEPMARVVELLVDAGILPRQPCAQLASADADLPQLSHIRACIERDVEGDPEAFSMRNAELAFLANTVVAGCSVQGRAFTAEEASDMVLATCNLGLENWRADWPAPNDYVAAHGLLGVFQVGWSVLYQSVSVHAAERLIAVLRDLRCRDLETQAGLTSLRLEMTRQLQAGTPWRARASVDVVAILDMLVSVALLGLFDECPVVTEAMSALLDRRTCPVSATAFEFIATNREIAAIHEFLQALPDLLLR